MEMMTRRITMVEYIFRVVSCLYDENMKLVNPEIEEVQRLVRCEGCRYSRDEYGDGECYCKRPGRELQWIGRRWDFFCAAGRKKGEDNGNN